MNIAKWPRDDSVGSAGGRSVTGYGLRYRLVDDAGGRFEIDRVSGLVSVADETMLGQAAARTHTIAVEMTLPRGSVAIRRFEITGPGNGGEFAVSAVADGVASAGCRPRCARIGAVVGTVAVAEDAGSGDITRFTLTEDAEGRFAIDASTGVVTVAGGALSNHERAPGHTITVQAESAGGCVSTQRFVIALGDGDGTFVVTAVADEEGSHGGIERRRLNRPTPRAFAHIAAA